VAPKGSSIGPSTASFTSSPVVRTASPGSLFTASCRDRASGPVGDLEGLLGRRVSVEGEPFTRAPKTL
jgi:hypothetical protein